MELTKKLIENDCKILEEMCEKYTKDIANDQDHLKRLQEPQIKLVNLSLQSTILSLKALKSIVEIDE